MLEVTANVSGAEGWRSGLLEDDGHDVVADVTLTEELLAVVWGEGKERRDMEHNLNVSVLVVNTVQPRRVSWKDIKKGLASSWFFILGYDSFF